MNGWMLTLPHLLRPWWLLALLALPLLGWVWRRRSRRDSPWTHVVDAHLLPSLLQPASATRRRSATWLFAFAYILAVLALAGPAWRRPVSMQSIQSPLVLVADMSSHMRVADLAPSRALRERLKIQQLIGERKGGQIGLVAYAGAAFTVAPISDDAHSLDDLVVALTPDTMPVDGQRADLALQRAGDLLAHAGYARGTILLLTDSADATAMQAARAARARGYRVDVVGVGTATGAPLPAANGTFATDDTGTVQVAKLDDDSLRALAQAGGGRYAQITSNDADLASLGVLDPAASATDRSTATTEALAWQDAGPWLLLLLLPLVALGFRRGWLAGFVVVCVFALPLRSVQASPRDVWQGLWQRNDQRADQALHAGDAAAAAKWASTPAQRAAAAYRKGDYAAAIADWARIDSADADYNRGNALAQQQHYDDAIAAWQQALRKQPGMADAQANIATVRKLLQDQKKQERQQQGQQQGQKPQSQKQQDQKQQDQKQQDQKQQDQKQQDQKQQGSQRDQKQPSSANTDSAASKDNKQGDGRDQRAGAPRVPQQETPNPSPAVTQKPQQQSRQQPQQQSQQPPERSTSQSPSQAAPDAAQQAKADAAQRQAMARALAQRPRQPAGKPTAAVVRETTAQRERRAANQALMQRVDDDPGSLLQRRFQLEYMRRQQEGQP